MTSKAKNRLGNQSAGWSIFLLMNVIQIKKDKIFDLIIFDFVLYNISFCLFQIIFVYYKKCNLKQSPVQFSINSINDVS